MERLLVTAGVLVRAGLVMMAQRYERGPEGGKWEFPGGKVELGEDPRHGLQRELREELGVEVTVGRVLEVISHMQAGRQLILLYFDCQLYRGEPVALDCLQINWFTPEQADLLVKPDPDQAFWERYRGEVSKVRLAKRKGETL
jgi:8-oxo-dGTP diphosphatase